MDLKETISEYHYGHTTLEPLLPLILSKWSWKSVLFRYILNVHVFKGFRLTESLFLPFNTQDNSKATDKPLFHDSCVSTEAKSMEAGQLLHLKHFSNLLKVECAMT